MYFFLCKSIYAGVTEFLLKFAVAVVILCALLIHYFSFTKMIQARLQKGKAATIVINK